MEQYNKIAELQGEVLELRDENEKLKEQLILKTKQ